MAQTGIHPYHLLEYKSEREIIEMLKDSLRQIVKYFKDKPVWYRTFDARTDEFKELKGGDKEKKEENPMIGNHGIRRALKEDWLIKLELKAIKELRKEGYKKIGVMIPFTIHPEELVKVKDIMRSIGLEPHKDLELGIMLETPAAAMMIDEYIGIGIDFVSFGTNDLTQLVLGIDRGNEDIQDLFTELHPAVLRLIQKVIQKCNAAGVKTSICGQAGSNPEMAEHLVKFGIKSISANIDAVETIRRKVKEVEEKLYG
jgi:pyruvate,water dikinase